MFKMIVISLFVTVCALAEAPVLKTGQTQSYNLYGHVVTDGSIKDDGYYQKGKARSYSRSGDVVTDNATGLEWQDSEITNRRWVTQENFDLGYYDDISGDTAATYCLDLPLGNHSDWRLPTVEELGTLVDSSQYDPAVKEGLFAHILSSNFWSFTTESFYPYSAWTVNFYTGGSGQLNKNYIRYFRCVRGKQMVPSNFSRSGEIVTDSSTGLQWQDDEEHTNWAYIWTDAISFCENTLTLGGHNDWRMPNINELSSIVDYSRDNPAMDDAFVNIHVPGSYTYWSSTSDAEHPYAASIVRFSDGATGGSNKGGDLISRLPVRCVRGNIHHFNPSVIMYLLN